MRFQKTPTQNKGEKKEGFYMERRVKKRSLGWRAIVTPAEKGSWVGVFLSLSSFPSIWHYSIHKNTHPKKQAHHEGEVRGDPDDDDESPLMLLESLPEVPRDRASLSETEQASAGSFFIGVNGGVVGGEEGLDWHGWATSSSPEELPISKREGDVSGVSNGVSTRLGRFASLS